MRLAINHNNPVAHKNFYWQFFFVVFIFFQTACNKLVEIDPPASTITTSETFSDSVDANSAITGIYTKLINTDLSPYIGNGALSIYTGLSADELINFNADPETNQFLTNTLQSSNSISYGGFWYQAYQYIYQANASIEGINQSTGISQTAKNKFIGEAKFLRSFLYFYLVNLYGDVPLITTSDFKTNALASRTPKSEVYNFLIKDLNEAHELLPDDYSYWSNERTRATKWAATALLARVYLYVGDWQNAATQSQAIINNTSTFFLQDLNNVFLANSPEAILQWQLNTSRQPFNATTEGYYFIPLDSIYPPFFYLTPELLNGFENGDQRKAAWVDSTNYNGTVYYYPYKYKIGPALASPNAPATEYYMVLRLAEQYLIRAEARAQSGDIDGAFGDINLIRSRAALPPLNTTNQADALAAIAQERRIEFFVEWGHRWCDLKRTNKANEVLGAIKPSWIPDQQLYPIYKGELATDPNLVQNPGY